MDLMCPLSPTGISLKATRPPVLGIEAVRREEGGGESDEGGGGGGGGGVSKDI